MGDQTAKPPVTGYPAAHPGAGYYPANYPARPGASGAAYNGGYAQSYPAYPQPYPTYQAPPPSRYRSRRFLSIIVTLAVIAGIAFLITWLVLRPQRPKFHVENVTVSQLSVANSKLNTTMQFSISARNPNKKIGIYYDEIGARAIYRGQRIGWNQLPTFYQGHRNTSILTFPLSADSQFLETDISNHLLGDKATGSMDMTVSLVSWVRFKVGSWRTRHHAVSVFCDVTVHWSNSTTGRLSQARRCDVYM